jgi:hypothetical protein
MIIRDKDLGGITLHNFINTMRAQGEKLKDSILQLPDDKYAEITMISYNNNFYTGWVVLDTYIKKVHDEYFEVFSSNHEALKYNLEVELNGRRYE